MGFKKIRPKLVLEWSYWVQCDLLIALYNAMSGLPARRKLVCTVVALPSAKPLFIRLLILQNPPPPTTSLAALVRHRCPLPLATAALETLPETSVIVLPP